MEVGYIDLVVLLGNGRGNNGNLELVMEIGSVMGKEALLRKAAKVREDIPGNNAKRLGLMVGL